MLGATREGLTTAADAGQSSVSEPTSSRIAIVVVHYHASDWLARAVTALSADVAASRLDAELVVVDNGGSAADRAVLAGLPVRAIDAGENRGYAGGVNLGVRSTSAPWLVAMNPDVDVLPGCLPRLVESLERGSAAAGPRFYWDGGKEMLLPPTERREPLQHALRRLALRGGAWLRLARRAWRRHARRHWLAAGALRSHALSGALLALRRDAWQAVGPFDEGFRLYFEETDWLLRLKDRGLDARYVPAAEAVHHYQRSAAREPSAPRWFAESEARFESRRYGPRFRAELDRWSRPRNAAPQHAAPQHAAAAAAPVSAAPPEIDLTSQRGLRWIEVSPSPLGFPAAACRVASANGRWRLPASVWDGLAPGTYGLEALDAADRSLLRRSFRKDAAEAADARGDG